jgi:hypothetical protein
MITMGWIRPTLAFALVLPLVARGEEKPKEEDDTPPPAQLTLNPGGVYHGVAPGKDALPPHPPKLPIKKGPQRLTWSGFQMKDGTPTVFLQTTGVPDYQVSESKGALVVTLRNTKIHLRNNRRPLRLEAWDTNVTKVEAQANGHDTRVTIHMKGAAAHKEHVEPAAGGFQFLVISLK